MKKIDKSFPYKSILIACSVNTARSPMAEGFLKDYFIKNKAKIDVNSCGVSSNARDGMLISLDSRLVMREIGIELSEDNSSKDLKKHPELLNGVDLILTLTEQHKKEILNIEEALNKKAYTLKEFAGESGDIKDPSMKGIKGFKKARDEIIEYLVKALEKYDFN